MDNITTLWLLSGVTAVLGLIIAIVIWICIKPPAEEFIADARCITAITAGARCTTAIIETADALYITEDRFRSFIHDLVNEFKHQASFLDKILSNKQFAVLYLSSAESDCELNKEFQTISSKDSKLTNPNEPTWPEDKKLYNYITARPHNSAHAEELIMDKLTKLMDKTKNVNVRYTILYTWLFPCTNCTSKIISEFEQHKSQLSGSKIYVVYSDIREEEKEGKTQLLNNLKDADIEVVRVYCKQ